MKQVITKKWIHTLNAALQVPKGDNIDTSTMSRDVIRVCILLTLITLSTKFTAFNSFHPTGLFLHPPEKIRQPQIFRCFQRVWKETSDMDIVSSPAFCWGIDFRENTV